MKHLSMNGKRVRKPLPKLRETVIVVALALMPTAAVWAADEPVALQSVNYDGTLSAQASQVLGDLERQAKGKTMDKVQAQVMAQEATAALRASGFPVATVLLQDGAWEQFQKSGVLKLRAFEGEVGRVVVRSNTSHVDSTRLQRTTEQALCADQMERCTLTTKGLERAELLLQDLPGVKLQPVLLSPEGVSVGQTSVEVTAEQSQPRVRVGASVDNYGFKSSGVYRFGASVEANNLLHMGDVWQASGMLTDKHQNTGALGFSMPIGYQGLRVQASASRTNYSLPQVGATGRADSASAGLSYPILRALNRNWTGSVEGFYVRSEQEVAGFEAFAPSHLQGVRFGLSSNAGDRPAELGMNYWSANAVLTLGRNRQDLNGFDITDTVGSYQKLAASAFGKRVLGSGWYALGNMRGQIGSRNMSTYEAMSLGGVTGVRAYSPEEGTLNEGVFLSVELRKLIPLPNGMGQLAPGVFVDYINGRVLHNPYPGWQTSLGYANPNVGNHRWLGGWGVGVDWVLPNPNVTASLTVGWKLPGSPDSEYKPGSAKARVLFSLAAKF
jgi:hemolysin activation/secretion protein